MTKQLCTAQLQLLFIHLAGDGPCRDTIVIGQTKLRALLEFLVVIQDEFVHRTSREEAAVQRTWATSRSGVSRTREWTGEGRSCSC